MTFGGNTRDLGSFGEETDEINDLHQDSPRSIVLIAWRRRHRHKAAPSYGYSSVGRFDVFFRDQLLVFQQHQDESLYDSWTRFKDVIPKVPNHGLSIWTLIEIFLKHLDSLSCHIINMTAKGDLRKFSDIGACKSNAQIVGDDMVRVNVPRCMAWLDYDEHVDSLSTMDNEGLESKEVSPLGKELSLFDRPNEVERGRIIEAHRLESILQQQISQRIASSHHDGFYAVLSSDLTYKIACRKFLIKNKKEIFTDAGDGVRIIPDDVAPPAM
ncbi:hypothetical protein Tco_0618661 [Tanacetum coccineum]